MKSRGDILREALDEAGALPLSVYFCGRREDYPAAVENVLERAATEYDRATRAELPEDVEAYLQEVEARADKATPGPWFDSRYHDDQLGPHIEGLDERPVAFCSLGAKEHSENGAFIANARADIPRLVAIVREQASKIELLQHAFDLEVDGHRFASDERDVFRERLAKFETCIVCEAFLLPPDIPPHCNDSCIVEEEHEAEWEAFCRRAERCTDDT